jgi:hypothetical protein
MKKYEAQTYLDIHTHRSHEGAGQNVRYWPLADIR